MRAAASLAPASSCSCPTRSSRSALRSLRSTRCCRPCRGTRLRFSASSWPRLRWRGTRRCARACRGGCACPRSRCSWPSRSSRRSTSPTPSWRSSPWARASCSCLAAPRSTVWAAPTQRTWPAWRSSWRATRCVRRAALPPSPCSPRSPSGCSCATATRLHRARRHCRGARGRLRVCGPLCL